jgi:hypothetical protein
MEEENIMNQEQAQELPVQTPVVPQEPAYPHFQDIDIEIERLQREKIELEEAARERAEYDRKVSEATDPVTGNFRTLGHRLAFYDELQNFPPGGPNPFSYRPDDDQKFQEDVGLFKTTGAIKQGVAEALHPPNPLDNLPVDELALERREDILWQQDCEKKAKQAEADGDLTKAKAWRDRGQFLHKDLQAKGPTKREQIVKEYEIIAQANPMKILGEESLDDSPMWNHPKAQHDSAVAIHQFNQDAAERWGMFVMPKEKPRFGDIEAIKPSNMVLVQVPKDVYQSVKSEVYGWNSSPDPTEQFKRLHSALIGRGYQDFKPSITKIREMEEEPEPDANPDAKWSRMTQRDFEAMRDRQEAARRARR